MARDPEIKEIRQLKVYLEERESRSRLAFLCNTRLRPAPKIRLVGRWLEAAGFRIGAQVEVEVSEGRLVVTVLEDADGSHSR
jgi:hypothetical protein